MVDKLNIQRSCQLSYKICLLSSAGISTINVDFRIQHQKVKISHKKEVILKYQVEFSTFSQI